MSSSNKSFGLLLFAFFAVLAAYGYFRTGAVSFTFACLAFFFLIIALSMPRVLAPFKSIWLKFGWLLSVIISPIVLGLIYCLAIVPVGVLTRLFGKDLLSLKLDRTASSYWVTRKAGGPGGDSMKEQF